MGEAVRMRRALISVYDKTGVVEFARALHAEFGFEILSTGGTATALQSAGLPVTPVEQVTGFPELMDGRVKTLHPRIHAALLADRDNPEHMRQLAAQGIAPIDVVVVNLYPFERTVADPKCAFERAIEMIDIGGPCLLRAAAKNHRHVLVECRPVQHSDLLHYLRDPGNPRFENYRAERALAVYRLTADYDGKVASWLSRDEAGVPQVRFLELHAAGGAPLRYAENPHQAGEVRRLGGAAGAAPGVVAREVAVDLAGPRMSFNNYLDASAAFELCAELARAGAAGWRRPMAGGAGGGFSAGSGPKRAETARSAADFTGHRAEAEACARVVCFIKHTNACGVGLVTAADGTPAAGRAAAAEAYRRAYLGDPNAALGGILAVNFDVDVEFAALVLETYARFGKPLKDAGAPHAPGGFFVEVWLAPRFTSDACALIRGTYSAAAAAPEAGEAGPASPTALPGGVPQKDWGRRVRLLAVGDLAAAPDPAALLYRSIAGGVLVQSPDLVGLDEEQWRVVTARAPTPAELADLRLAWLVCKHTKSNAITLCRDGMLLGNGAGQMSRVMSCRIATWLARENGHGERLAGAVAASDAFFPFRDGPEILLDAGITALIQPGGSKRDEDTIRACDARGAALIFTGTRHFRH